MTRRPILSFLALALAAIPAHAGWQEVELMIHRPARLDARPGDLFLVLSFEGKATERVDPGVEVALWMQRALDYRAGLVPAPAPAEIPPPADLRQPETLMQLAAETGATWIAFGNVQFTIQDRSGFVPDTLASPITGQTARRTRFRERKSFRLEVEVVFARGSDGATLHQDTWSEEKTLDAGAADEIQVFFDLLDRMKERLGQVFTPAPVRESRFIWVD